MYVDLILGIMKYQLTNVGPDGIAWLLGLLQGGLGVTGFVSIACLIEAQTSTNISQDGVAHMIEGKLR